MRYSIGVLDSHEVQHSIGLLDKCPVMYSVVYVFD